MTFEMASSVSYDSLFTGLLNYYLAFSVIYAISYYSFKQSSIRFNKSVMMMVSLIIAVVIGAWLGNFLITHQLLFFLY